MQIGEATEYFTEILRQNNIDGAKYCVQIILCDVLNMQKIDLTLNSQKNISAHEKAIIEKLVERLTQGMPVQYATGNAFFREYILEVTPEVLIPRPETEELISLVFEENQNYNESLCILDIGTGSGCLAIALANKYKKSRVLALDVDSETLAVAKRNAEKYCLDNIEFAEMNILEEIPNKLFDIIVSNPPYIPKEEIPLLDANVRDYEPQIALTDGADGLTFYRRFAEIFENLLTKNGRFYLEAGFDQSKNIISFFNVTKFRLNVSYDFAMVPRIIFGSVAK